MAYACPVLIIVVFAQITKAVKNVKKIFTYLTILVSRTAGKACTNQLVNVYLAQAIVKTCTSETCKKMSFQNIYSKMASVKTEMFFWFFYVLNNAECKPCGKDCAACTNNEECTVCTKGKFLKNGLCVDACGVGYFSTPENICKKCSTNCDVCTSDKTCTKCSKDTVLYKDECKIRVSSKLTTTKMGVLQKKCSDNCDICTNIGNCSKCKASFSWDPIAKKCVEKCNDGYSSLQSICAPCEVKDCKNCDSSSKKCDQCTSDKFKLGDSCVNQCPDSKILPGR